jgi:phosphoglucosamine mutase
VGRLFGTDGVRGVAGVDLTAALASALASAAVLELTAGRTSDDMPRVVIGRDTRPSGTWLEAAVVEGCLAAGADTTLLGVIPTPGVAHIVAASGADLGVMISASHNPMPDNGIKFFGEGGHKLPDEMEDRIEQRLTTAQGAVPARTGRVLADSASAHRADYVAHLLSTVLVPIEGIRVVVDCANGAASTVAPEVYRKAGADVVVINDDVDGQRINEDCGATHLEGLQRAVKEHHADIGIAHDGDADRCIAIDAAGEVVDGDAILAILALALHERGELVSNAVVTTVMTNLGFKRAMAQQGIAVRETPVGDRYVLELMREEHLVLGGEQSGHVVLLTHASTGDGILTGLQLLARMAETGRPLSDLAAPLVRLPQVLLAERVPDQAAAMSSTSVAEAVAAAESELGEHGRVLVRPSGTEPVIRVMVEAPDESTAQSVARRVAAAVRSAAGG